MKFRIALLLLLFVSILLPGIAGAQCAMCKAVVESNATSGDNIVEGINNGILYLMGIPYLLMITIGVYWYRKFWKAQS